MAGFCRCESADILHLANRADLARIRGISGVYSDLLEIAGVDTVKELATRRADHLFAKIAETNDRDRLTTKPPTQSIVQNQRLTSVWTLAADFHPRGTATAGRACRLSG